jgi:hypothetical protein
MTEKRVKFETPIREHEKIVAVEIKDEHGNWVPLHIGRGTTLMRPFRLRSIAHKRGVED